MVIPFLKDRAERRRISRQIEANGGNVMEITKVWNFGNHYEHTYEVSYKARAYFFAPGCILNFLAKSNSVPQLGMR